jgi:hypothetical protein
MSDSSDTRGNVLVEDAESFRQRWETIQAGFVDEPKRAVEEADALVSELIKSLTDSFTAERQNLEQQWSSRGEASTDDLRRGLQRYRSFFRRLLSQSSPDSARPGGDELPPPRPGGGTRAPR